MKLLSKADASNKVKAERRELISQNIRLRGMITQKTKELRNLKVDYSDDKRVVYEGFKKFCDDIQVKKAKLLKELSDIENEINSKKDLLFSLVERQDELLEREYEVNERNKKLDLREKFVSDIEDRIKKSA